MEGAEGLVVLLGLRSLVIPLSAEAYLRDVLLRKLLGVARYVSFY